jgi:hypothetical protein
MHHTLKPNLYGPYAVPVTASVWVGQAAVDIVSHDLHHRDLYLRDNIQMAVL